jgi:hypothetical protein
MTKTSTKKRSNRKPAAAALVVAAVTKKKLSPGSNTSTGKPRKKSRKNVSHQQTIQARDTLDAEYRDWRTVSKRLQYCSHPFSFFLFLSRHHNNPALLFLMRVCLYVSACV